MACQKALCHLVNNCKWHRTKHRMQTWILRRSLNIAVGT
jgi:hypothetical protein